MDPRKIRDNKKENKKRKRKKIRKVIETDFFF